MSPEKKAELEKLLGPNIKFDEPMSRHTSFRIGGPAEAFAVPENREQLIEIVNWTVENGIDCFVIGNGTNLLVMDGGIDGVVIDMKKGLNEISADGCMVSAGAGASLHRLCSFAIESELAGMNFAVGIPGTVGGAIVMNAGTAIGSMEDVIESAEALLPDGNVGTFEKKDLAFGYRSLSFPRIPEGKPVILGGRFLLGKESCGEELRKEAKALLSRRREKQPLNYPNAGSFFKNPRGGKTAGELIDKAGLKGKTVGGASVSEKHANFIINKNDAKATDIIDLMEIIRETVLEMLDIELEPEVKIVGKQACK